MNDTYATADVGMIRLAVGADCAPDYFQRATDQIRQIPAVTRVRTSQPDRELEILFRQPAPGLLREIHLALKSAGAELLASKSW